MGSDEAASRQHADGTHPCRGIDGARWIRGAATSDQRGLRLVRTEAVPAGGADYRNPPRAVRDAPACTVGSGETGSAFAIGFGETGALGVDPARAAERGFRGSERQARAFHAVPVVVKAAHDDPAVLFLTHFPTRRRRGGDRKASDVRGPA